jgi:hypothetical protein
MATLERTVERREYSPVVRKRTSWGAIFGGSFIALGIMMILGTLGLAVGATVIDPATADPSDARAFGIGGAIWWIVSGMIALFGGGVAAGRLAGLRRRGEGPLHGLVTWAVTTIATFFLAMSMIGSVVSGAMGAISAGARGMETAGQLSEALPEDVKKSAEKAVTGAAQDVRETAGEATGQEVEQKARGAAETGADVLATAAWVTFFYLILTAFLAALGGMLGSPRESRGEKTPRRHPREGEVVPG